MKSTDHGDQPQEAHSNATRQINFLDDDFEENIEMTATVPESSPLSQQPEPARQRTGKPRWRKVLRALAPILILGVGVGGATYLKDTGPEVHRRKPSQRVPLVQISEPQRISHTVTVSAMGTVIPAQELMLKSRVAGEIIAAHTDFVEGGLLNKGDEILRIDPADYELEVIQKKGDVETATYQLKLELGHQDVAKREWQILNGNAKADPQDKELALRKPHLAKARADLAAAKASLKQAELDLQRTVVQAPFNAVIRERNVEVGSQIDVREQLATLVGTDSYWVQVSLPVERLKWIRVPREAGQEGSAAKILYAGGYTRKGKVIKLLSDLKTEGRLARVLVSVSDPLNLRDKSRGSPPLLIGEYVRVEIEGRQLADVFEVPRTALRDGSNIWIASKNDSLEVRTVETVWRDNEKVFLRDGLVEGERLVVSDLPTAVNGMPVRVQAAGGSTGKGALARE